jgi:hypothetical protein
MIEIVERHSSERKNFEPGELSDVYLLLGCVRAFRCFDSIQLLADDGPIDDALVLRLPVAGGRSARVRSHASVNVRARCGSG